MLCWHAVKFEFYRTRFRFRPAGLLYFPPYKAGNLVRGAFGTIFRGLVCQPDCRDARSCEVRGSCPYARIFEPRAARGEGPSGLLDWPRPFVFRAAHLDGRTLTAGELFYFDVHLFDIREPGLPYFVAAFEQLARLGLGSRRVRADLVSVEQLNLEDAAGAQVYDGGSAVRDLSEPIAVDLSPMPHRVSRARVHFITPTELKSGHQVVDRPEFAVLFGRLRDRISSLGALYGRGPLEIDFRAMGERAACVRMTRCEWLYSNAERLSSRSGQRHSLGGFTGEAEYAGELEEFVPYLGVGRWTGVGRQTVWGKGEIVLETL